MVTLDIISDPICPWCYIGKARLDAAIAETGINPFQTHWRIFELNPDMPAQGMDRKAYLEAKFGGPESAEQVYSRIRREAERSGLDLDFDRIARTPNTFDAHRLIRWAQAQGVQDRVADELFRRYFEQGADISDHAVLLEVAEAAGLEREVVARLLEGDAEREALRQEEESIRGMGVQGVPCFVIGGKYVLQGAQESETWKQVLTELDQAIRSQAAEQPGEAPPAE